MTRIKTKRVRIAPQFYECLKLGQIQQGFKSLAEYTNHLAKTDEELKLEKIKNEKNKKLRFSF